MPAAKPIATRRGAVRSQPAQALFNFDTVAEELFTNPVTTAQLLASESESSIAEQAEKVARDYQLQMQSYALALRELLGVRTGSGPGFPRGQPARGGGSDRVADSTLSSRLKINTLSATLHFIDPNIEIHLPAALLDLETCAQAIDEAMLSIATLDGTIDADRFPPLPATHCRICNFLDLCPAGREWLGVQNRER